ncbi:MAG: hypothetical protein Q4P11_00070 [Methanobrevibacter sp.]|nr:hypothetical protein [Methanobrevibacter sp.]
MDLNFEINNQVLSRQDENILVNKSKNYVFCNFKFKTVDWDNNEKFAIFKDSWGKSYVSYLGTGNDCRCVVPNEALKGTNFRISVYGGDLITSSELTILLVPSGYTTRISPTAELMSKDVFVDIFDRLQTKIDDIVYEDGYLRCYSAGKVIAELMLLVDIEEQIKELIPSFHLDEEGNLYVNYP